MHKAHLSNTYLLFYGRLCIWWSCRKDMKRYLSLIRGLKINHYPWKWIKVFFRAVMVICKKQEEYVKMYFALFLATQIFFVHHFDVCFMPTNLNTAEEKLLKCFAFGDRMVYVCYLNWVANVILNHLSYFGKSWNAAICF